MKENPELTEPLKRSLPTLLSSYPALGDQWAMTIDIVDLHRLQRVRRRLPGREQHPRRRQGAACADGREMHWLRIDTLLRAADASAPGVVHAADALPALREGALRVRVPGQRHGAQPRRPQRDGLQPLRRHAVLLEQLPVQGAALQLVRLYEHEPTNRDCAAAAQPRRHRARARRDGEVHVLRAAHPRRGDRARASSSARSARARW